MNTNPVALIAGVGAAAGLGAALARRFARENYTAVVAGRTQARLAAVVDDIVRSGGRAHAVATDVAVEAQVEALAAAAEAQGPIEVAIYNAGGNMPSRSLETPAQFFEEMWRTGTLGGFVFAREAVKRMLPRARGTLLFTGASASLRGRPDFAAFAAAKAALRSVSQSFAREFGPQGIHVAHVVIDGGIAGERLQRLAPGFVQARGADGLLDLEAIAESYWQLHRQHRSAWSQEIDLRPFKEPF